MNAHLARFRGALPDEVEAALRGEDVLLEEAAVALHEHVLRRLPVAPDAALLQLTACARTYGHLLSLMLLAARPHGRDERAWREGLQDALLALVHAHVMEEAVRGSLLAAQTRHEGLAVLAAFRDDARDLALDPHAETDAASRRVVEDAARFRLLYGLVPG